MRGAKIQQSRGKRNLKPATLSSLPLAKKRKAPRLQPKVEGTAEEKKVPLAKSEASLKLLSIAGSRTDTGNRTQ